AKRQNAPGPGRTSFALRAPVLPIVSAKLTNPAAGAAEIKPASRISPAVVQALPGVLGHHHYGWPDRMTEGRRAGFSVRRRKQGCGHSAVTEDHVVTKIQSALVSAALAIGMSAPASAAQFDPEAIIYRFPGVRDDGGAANVGVATVFVCTNF